MKIRPWSDYPILPEDIDTTRPFLGVFGSYESEEVARAIVRYCQYRNSWTPFTIDNLSRFFVKGGSIAQNISAIIKGHQALVDSLYIENDAEDAQIYYVTGPFIDRCHTAAPADKRV